MKKLDESRPSMGIDLPPPVPTVHFSVCYPGSGGYPGGSVSEEGVFVLCPA